MLEALKFPHYKQSEVEIAKRFIATNTLVGEYKTDIKLSITETERDKLEPENYRKMWAALKAKRIDMTCETDSNLWIIEIKDLLLPSAIGQLMLYRDMYARQYKPGKEVRLIIVSGHDDYDVRKFAESQGIRVVII